MLVATHNPWGQLKVSYEGGTDDFLAQCEKIASACQCKTDDDIIYLCVTFGLVAAIKYHRRAHGSYLKNAKDAVEFVMFRAVNSGKVREKAHGVWEYV